MNRSLRIVGALLLISPFLNFIMSVAMLPPSPHKWTWAYLSTAFMAATAMQWALRISKVVIGYLMVRAKSSAWLPVLVILAVTIAYNFLTFSKDFHTNSFQAISAILINFVLFGMVLNAEIQAQRELNAKLAAARAARAAPKAAPVTSEELVTPQEHTIVEAQSLVAESEAVILPFVAAEDASPEPAPETEVVVDFVIAKGSQIDFEGYGQFAEVIHCQDDELWIKGNGEAPWGITTRPVILESPEYGTSIRLQYLRNDTPDIMIFKVS